MQVIFDDKQRKSAINPELSCIVQAPAGSGKTELLIQRTLRLLGIVARPDEVLAITFTRKAAGEMRERLYRALESAKNQPCPDKPHEKLTWTLARKAVERGESMGWNLFEDPNALQIQTIDSLCSMLSSAIPLLSRFGGKPTVVTDPLPLYKEAAERAIAFATTNETCSAELSLLLKHLDNRASILRSLIITMLMKRDQWLRHVVGPDNVSRDAFEGAIVAIAESRMASVSRQIPSHVQDAIMAAGTYAASHLVNVKPDSKVCAFVDMDHFPEPFAEDLESWQAVAELLLNKKGQPRGKLDKSCGFPAKAGGLIEAKENIQVALDLLENDSDLCESLARLADFPAASFSDGQWGVLNALSTLLPFCVGHLWMVFQEKGEVDFAQVAQGAVDALGSADDPTDLLLRVDNKVSHILVDEFQDTNWLQFELLGLLTSGWQKGDGRTLFLVGDPMQSIYRFREAEVGLFLKARAEGIGNIELEPLTLGVNFRSQAGIVDWVNHTFAESFPDEEDDVVGAIPYTESVAVHELNENFEAVTVHPMVHRNDTAEAEQMMEVLNESLADPTINTTAVLVRSRTHLLEVVRLLREQGVRFQAQEIDTLGDRPYVQDAVALTRAIRHLADRVAWLATLRAPWCGLTLEDICVLCEEQTNRTILDLAQDSTVIEGMSPDGRERLGRIIPVLKKAVEKRCMVPLRRLVEATWVTIGGPSFCSQSEIADLRVVFELIEELDDGCDIASLDVLDNRLSRLYAAPDPEADARLQIMTIHKAKGLEFDTVLLPGLGKKPKRDDKTLLRWIELPSGQLLLAPIPQRGDTDSLYDLVGRYEAEKSQHESVRLLYVAATRAKQKLHLFGHVDLDRNDVLTPAKDSLLSCIWSAVDGHYHHGQVFASDQGDADNKPKKVLRRYKSDWRPTLPQSNVDVPKPSEIAKVNMYGSE